tara:strand:- start:1835 stop:2764 length:930 start_codon:yes stop_codon:yes gene_type:complete
MKIKILIFFLFFLFFFETSSNANKNNKIIVKIDNQLITSYDIKNKIITTLVLGNQKINQTNIDALKTKALEDLIRNRLKKIELKKFDIKRNNSRIDSYLNSISSNNIQNLKSLFNKNNIDFETFVDELDIEFRWRNLIFKKYSKKIEIDPENITRDINNIIEKRTNLIEYNLSEIEILVNNDDGDINRIMQIQSEIKNYSFEDAVIKFSIASTSKNKGQLGWVNSNSLSKDILIVLDNMEIGQTSKPIRRQDKIIFLKLNNKKTSDYSDIDINKLRERLIEQRKNDLFALYSNSLLSKLKNNKFIEYYK